MRAVDTEDRELLYRIYASTRVEEMAQVPWTDQQKENFLRFQFHAQHAYYQEHFPKAHFDLIIVDEEPVGRLYLDVRDDEHRLIDIALLPEHRGRGLGTALLRKVLEAAAVEGKKVRIHVEFNNPAMRLYQRLGFHKIEEQGVYHLMEWRPDTRMAATGGKEQ